LDVHEGGDCHLIRQFLLTSTSNTGITETELLCQEQARLEATGVAECIDNMSGTSGRKTMANTSDDTERGDDIDYTQTRYHPERHSGAISPNSQASLEDSEKFHEMAVATETPPKQCFLLDDDGEFPPMQGPSSSTKSPRTRNNLSANPSDNNDD
jgi:hypothetical protein